MLRWKDYPDSHFPRKVMNVVVNTFQGGIVLGGLTELKGARRKVIVVHDRVPLRIDRSKSLYTASGSVLAKYPLPWTDP